MSECEVCGGSVEVVGGTTKSYKNLDKEEVQSLKSQLEAANKEKDEALECIADLGLDIDMRDMKLKSARAVIEFYSHERLIDNYKEGFILTGHRYDISCASCNEQDKGKRARQWLKEDGE